MSLLVKTDAGEITVAGSDILVATGRVPNTTSIGLEIAGVQLTEQGYVKVDDRLQTTAAGYMGESVNAQEVRSLLIFPTMISV